jgi:spore coat protein CotH
MWEDLHLKAHNEGGHSKRFPALLIICFSALLLTTPFLALQSSGLAVKPSNNPWVAGKLGDEADAFFNDSYVHEIRLYFDDPNWYNTLYNGHDKDPSDPYFPARFISQGITLNQIGVRFKGLSSFGGSNFPNGGNQGIKKPFRLDFNEYDEGSGGKETTFFGLKKLDLNNGFADATMLHEKLFNDFASKYVEAPRSAYTRVYVNDNYYGLYLAMEHIDNTYVESRFGGDENGNLFKVEYGGTLEYRGADWARYNGSYELKSNEELNNWTDLIQLTDILSNTPRSDLQARLEPVLDVKSAIDSLALLSLFSSLDSYIGNARNYYLYDRDDTGQFTLLLWDANLAFGSFRMLLKPSESTSTLDPFPPVTMRTNGGGSGGNLTLTKNVLAVEAYNRTYLRDMAQMMRDGFNGVAVGARVQELATIIRSVVYEEPNYSVDEKTFEAALSEISSFVQARSAYLETRFNAYGRKSDLSLNELMASNHGTIRDSANDYEPWVEIYNRGPGQVNASGVYLTDDSAVPNKWALPAQNVDDGQFLLLWLDNETTEGANHAPLRLNSGGGELYLYVRSFSNYTLISNVTYPALLADTSYSRYPNGEGKWIVTENHATPGQPNIKDDVPTDLFINEFMADNKATTVGPNGGYPDWIELFNARNQTVDLSGMYLTDDLANPTACCFPNGTTIEPGGYLLVWADKSDGQGALHANFALSADGEKVGLFAKDGKTNIDYVVFSEQFNDASFGRYLDGNFTWNYLTPTPGSSNSLGPHSVTTTPTPTPSPTPQTPSPSNSPSATPAPTPTQPAPTPSAPTNQPTPTTPRSPSPTATLQPTIAPTLNPTATPTPTPSLSPSLSPTATSPSLPTPSSNESPKPSDASGDSTIMIIMIGASLGAVAAGAATTVVVRRRKR